MKIQLSTWLVTVDTDRMEVGIFASRRPSWLTMKFDLLHENFRWRSRITSLFLRFFDCFSLFFFKNWIPSIRVREDLPVKGAKFYEINNIETLMTFKWRYISIIKKFLESECEYLYMTNSSCYLDVPKFLLYVDGLEKRPIYAGSKIVSGRYSENIFASGANRLISRDIAEKIMLHRKNWNNYELEDLGLGRLLSKLNIHVQDLRTLNLSTIDDVASLSKNITQNCFHYRLKSFDSPFKIKRNDSVLMLALHSKISSLK
jgi:hypothetical protein